jgi:hypothetical protein
MIALNILLGAGVISGTLAMIGHAIHGDRLHNQIEAR